ncbi:mCG1027379 [Mus musculus]|nr:mCG1027379 [Mus musculus]
MKPLGSFYWDPRRPPFYCRMDLNTSTAYSYIQMATSSIIFAVTQPKH